MNYPRRDDANWLKHTLLSRGSNGEHALHFMPVTITRFLPKERDY